jgi:microcystin-dependent protein
MAETTTARYGWTKPDPGASANTWGQTLNATTDKIDAIVWANQQAGVPIGGMVMFGGATAPPNWLICDGRSLPTTGGTYDALFAAIQYAHGGSGANFNLPNVVQKFPLGAGPNPVGASGGAFSVALGAANIPAHTHPIADPAHYHTITDQAHGHGVNQWAHSHAIATGGHSHSISTGGHAHTYAQWSSGGGGQNVRGDLPSYFQQNVGANTGNVGDLGGSSSFAGNLGGNTDGPTSAISIQNSGSNIHNSDWGVTNINVTGSFGSGAAFNVVPPFAALNFIIRYQ